MLSVIAHLASFKDYIIPFVVCLFLMIGLCSYWFVLRKKFVEFNDHK